MSVNLDNSTSVNHEIIMLENLCLPIGRFRYFTLERCLRYHLKLKIKASFCCF